MASAVVAAFVPAELCPDHFVAAGKLTQAELLARDLGHGASPLAACHSQHAVTTPRRFSSACRVATRGQPGWTGKAGFPCMRHQGKEGNSAGLAGVQKPRI